MQKAMIIGNLGRDAELKEVNGRQFISFTLAESDKRRTADGNVVESTTWYECTMNNGNVLPYLKKGTQVMVIGRSYGTGYISKQTGEVAVSMKCAVQEMQLLGSSNNVQHQAQPTSTHPAAQAQQSQAQYPYAQQAVAQQPMQATMQMPAEGDDDLPF